MKPFAPFRHLAYLSELRSRLPQPLRYNLSDSCAENLSIGQLLAMGDQQGFESIRLGYTPVAGSPSLREKLGARYNVEADSVITFCGAQEALFAAFNHILRPGDEVIALTPAYPSILAVPEQLGATIKAIPLEFDRQWQFDIDDIQSRLSPRTRLIVLNSPHNPSGSVMPRALARQILELASSHGIYLLSDEVSTWSNYHRLDLDYGFTEYDKAIVIGVMSKSLGLPGVRIGWAVCRDREIRQGMMDVHGYTSICGSAADEYLAATALDNADSLLARNNRLIAKNINHFQAFIDNSKGAFEWVAPQAGIMTLVKSNLDMPIKTLAERLAFDSQLLILPGDLFGISGDYFRLGLGRESFAEALAQFEQLALRS